MDEEMTRTLLHHIPISPAYPSQNIFQGNRAAASATPKCGNKQAKLRLNSLTGSSGSFEIGLRLPKGRPKGRSIYRKDALSHAFNVNVYRLLGVLDTVSLG